MSTTNETTDPRCTAGKPLQTVLIDSAEAR
jgi:hypothetical protein